ncbi:MAG TPA: DUF6799 domain-containing protein [Candidatus Acidoferrum sp.]|nr:DUF6799 domain-containing protein [Candidatus Acidoferrum sp.]
MKTNVLLIAFFTSLSALVAAPPRSVERVQFTSKKVVALPTREVLQAPDQINLPFNIVVRTNGTFTVNGGKMRALQEGEILGADGMLIKPDGSITLVVDHVTLNRGRVLVVRDGEPVEPNETVLLRDGTTVAPDWKITPPVGSPRRLLDGELFQLEGNSFPARDTITKQNGRMMVQKDGSLLALDPARSIMMNEGTKVLGDGTIITVNGDRATVGEGQIYIVQGVVTRPR